MVDHPSFFYLACLAKLSCLGRAGLINMVLKVCGLKSINQLLLAYMTTPRKKDIREEFGERLRHIRQERNLSQEDLAHLCDLDRSYVGGVERGERNISLLNIKKIADALGISPREFFDG